MSTQMVIVNKRWHDGLFLQAFAWSLIVRLMWNARGDDVLPEAAAVVANAGTIFGLIWLVRGIVWLFTNIEVRRKVKL